MEVEQAKQVLKEAGYYVDNLWSIQDVQANFDVDDGAAYDILNGVMHNEYTVQTINELLVEVGVGEYNLKKL